MSETVLFCIGAVIFAIVVYGSVMAGGFALARQMHDEESSFVPSVRDGESEAS
jgi:hypothetical protein